MSCKTPEALSGCSLSGPEHQQPTHGAHTTRAALRRRPEMLFTCSELHQTHNEYYLPYLAVFQSPFLFSFSSISPVPVRPGNGARENGLVLAVRPTDINRLLTRFLGQHLKPQKRLHVPIFLFLNLEKQHLGENNL